MPTRKLPLSLLYALAAIQEVYARITGKPVLLGLATVRLMVREAGAPVSIRPRASTNWACIFVRWRRRWPIPWLVSPAWLVLNG